MKKVGNIIKIFLSIILLCGTIVKGAAETVNYPGTEFFKQLNMDIPSLMAKYKIPGAVLAVIKNGELVFTNAYGYANVEDGRRMSTYDHFRVESISKSITAWGVMKLVEQGKVNLDTPVVEYLKSWEFPKSDLSTKAITVRQLLSHTSGLPLGPIGVRYSPMAQIPSLRESLTQNALPGRAPDSHFEYSNVGYHILELLIEEVTGLSFARYMEREVLTPLGMMHSSFDWQSSFANNIPTGYDFLSNPVPPYVYPEKAAGGLIATVEDIARFVCAGMENSNVKGNVLNKKSIKQLYTASVSNLGLYGFAFDSYGLGHLLEELPNGQIAVSHGGQGTGWMTHFHSIPQTGDGIVILTNSQRSWPFFAQVLTRWVQWNGFKRIGISIIATSEKILWAVVGLLILLAFCLTLKVVIEISKSARSFSPFSRTKSKIRIVLTLLFIFISAIYIWAVSQDYIFFTSIFPGITGWLVFLTPAIAIILLLVVLFPKSIP